MTITTSFTKGLHELGDHVFAYLQPTGSWGYSNAGLVAGDGTSLLVDTLFDFRLTREMLHAMRTVTQTSPIESLVNTHANGDHCYGNKLVPDRAKIYATVAAAEEMQELPASSLTALRDGADEEVRAFFDYAFGDFDLDEVQPRMPDQTFSESLVLSVGGREAHIVDLGPAHTQSDSIVYLPDDKIVFTGDLVFVTGTPIAWAGPIDNWLRACDRICELDVNTVVPGHGPVTDKGGVTDVRRYFAHIQDEARARHGTGMSAFDAALDIDLGEFAEWGDAERIVVTVNTIYEELGSHDPEANPLEMFRRMGRYRQDRLGANRTP